MNKTKPKSLGILPLFFLTIPSIGSAGTFSVGYELGQMALNDFKHVAGEIGYHFENDHALRINLFNVALSEKHLASAASSAVEGDNVRGLWRGVDLYYDYPITKKIFISPSIGYHDNNYTHKVLGTSVDQSSPTVGLALSYLGDDVLGFENLYWRFSLTSRYNLKKQEEVILGDSIVKGDSLAFIPAINIGYKF